MLTTGLDFYPLFFAAVLFAKEALPAPRNVLLSTWVTVMASSYFPPKKEEKKISFTPFNGVRAAIVVGMREGKKYVCCRKRPSTFEVSFSNLP